jgi:glycine/D-amino acid oxidase-like deaminating enzyme
MNTLTSFTDSRLAYAVESKHAVRQSVRWFSPSVLEIPMVFDNDDAREAAENLCDRLLAQLGPRYAIHLLPWKLTVTRFPQLAEIVAREAMRSPFLIVTVNGATALTPEVEAFLQRCAAAMRRGGAALVVQLYGIAALTPRLVADSDSKDEKELSPAYRCLKQIADDSKIQIFSTIVDINHQSRGAGRASPRRNGSPFVAFPPQTLPIAS